MPRAPFPTRANTPTPANTQGRVYAYAPSPRRGAHLRRFQRGRFRSVPSNRQIHHDSGWDHPCLTWRSWQAIEGQGGGSLSRLIPGACRPISDWVRGHRLRRAVALHAPAHSHILSRVRTCMHLVLFLVPISVCRNMLGRRVRDWCKAE